MKKPKDRAALKQFILQEIKRIADASDGEPPGMDKFKDITKIKRSQWEGTIWRYWNDALKEAGYEPQAFGTPAIPLDHLLKCLATLTRDLKRFPSHNDIRFARNTYPDFPAPDTFYERVAKRKDKLICALNDWVQGKKEYDDIGLILSPEIDKISQRPPKLQSEPAIDNRSRELSEGFIPPVIECLPSLARAESWIASLCLQKGTNEEIQFENRVATAFQILGLAVQKLGQGSGRVADGIAMCRPHGWAVVYDAKVRSNGFRMGTEDRKFREYIETHAVHLKAEGISKIYFAIISSSFAEEDLSKAKEITRVTDAKSCVFLEADALLRLVEKKLLEPLVFGLTDIERAFVSTRIVTALDILSGTAH